MSETFGDLMSDYERAKDSAKRFDEWSALDKFAEQLIKRVAPKNEKPREHFKTYAFDDMGTPVHLEEEGT